MYHKKEKRIEAHIFVAYLAYCLQVTLKGKLKQVAGALTPRAVVDKFASIQMMNVVFPTSERDKELVFQRYTHPEKDHLMLLAQLKWELPEQAPPQSASRFPLQPMKLLFYGKRETLIPPGKPVPAVAQFWSSDPRPRLTLYRGASTPDGNEHLLGQFEVMDLPSSANLNVSTLCVVANGQIIPCARDNNRDDGAVGQGGHATIFSFFSGMAEILKPKAHGPLLNSAAMIELGEIS